MSLHWRPGKAPHVLHLLHGVRGAVGVEGPLPRSVGILVNLHMCNCSHAGGSTTPMNSNMQDVPEPRREAAGLTSSAVRRCTSCFSRAFSS